MLAYGGFMAPLSSHRCGASYASNVNEFGGIGQYQQIARFGIVGGHVNNWSIQHVGYELYYVIERYGTTTQRHGRHYLT